VITVTQAATRLGLSGARVRVLIGQGRIRATKITPQMWLVYEPVKVLAPNTSSPKPSTAEQS